VDVLRKVLLGAAGSERLQTVVEKAPISRRVVARFIAGEAISDAVRATRELVDDGLAVTIDYLGENTVDHSEAGDVAAEYLNMIWALKEDGLTDRAELSLKLSAIGQALPDVGEKTALDNARRICAAATDAGTTVTLDMEDHTTTDSTLSILRELRKDFPTTGAVVQSYLYRTEEDCKALAHPGSRVRLCKGAYQ
jgi:proline dehydrogenase